MSFAQIQKGIVGKVITVDDKKQAETIPLAVVSYSDDSLLQRKNPYHIRRSQCTSNVEGLFSLKIPSTNCGKSFLVAEIMGYEPLFVDVDTLTTNNIIINLHPKIYDISVMYNNDTVYWKCSNLKEYSYAVVYPPDGIDPDIEPYYFFYNSNTFGELKLLPEPKIEFADWLMNFISEGKISDSTVIEITINRNPIEINYFSGNVDNKVFEFIRNEEWEVPYSFFSDAWMRRSEYNPPRKVRITFTKIE